MNAEVDAGIRRAFASGEFAKARLLWNEYAEALREAITDGKATAEDLAEARRTLEWARLQVKSFRAQAEARVGGARAAAAYAGFPPAPARRTRAVL